MRTALPTPALVIALVATACGASRGEAARESPVASTARGASPSTPPREEQAQPTEASPEARVPDEDTAGGDTRCVQDLPDDAAARWWDPLERGAASARDFEIAALPDLDGDGLGDHAVFSEALGCAGMGGNCMHLVYLSRSGCTSFAGAFYGAIHTVEVLPASRLGVNDLRVMSQDGCAGRAGAVLHLRWDGKSYAQVESTQCACPDDAPAERRSPQCPQ